MFIPANTWISGKNIGPTPIELTFVFSAPGFDETMRCNSVPAGETPTAITPSSRKTAHTSVIPRVLAGWTTRTSERPKGRVTTSPKLRGRRRDRYN